MPGPYGGPGGPGRNFGPGPGPGRDFGPGGPGGRGFGPGGPGGRGFGPGRFGFGGPGMFGFGYGSSFWGIWFPKYARPSLIGNLGIIGYLLAGMGIFVLVVLFLMLIL